jgi:hypothetical protein
VVSTLTSPALVPADVPLPIDVFNLGLRGNASAPLTFDLTAPAGDRVGAPSTGFGLMLGVVMPWFSLGNAAVSLGLSTLGPTAPAATACGRSEAAPATSVCVSPAPARTPHSGAAVRTAGGGRIHNGRIGCTNCTGQQRLRELLGDDSGEIRPDLQALHHALTAANRPTTVVTWLDRSAASTILRDLAGRPLTHQALDERPSGKPVEHLRSVLVAIGTLPARDERMARLEGWIAHTIADRSDPNEQQLLHRYAVWHLLRRLRGRLAGTDTTHDQAVVVQQHVKAAITLLNWLNAAGLSLVACQTTRPGHMAGWRHRRAANCGPVMQVNSLAASR